jgi:hypothetical protein
MFSQLEIEEWLTIGSEDHLDANELVSMSSLMRENNFTDTKKQLKIFLLEMMTQVERWDLVAEYFIAHPALEHYLIDSLGTEIHIGSDGLPQIWHTKFVFMPYMPLVKILTIDTQTYNPILAKCISIGELDLELIERINNLKAFW